MSGSQPPEACDASQRRSLRRHLTYANVMSTLAVVLLVCGGTAYATHLVVKSGDVVDGTLLSRDLNDGHGVRGADVADGSLSGADIRDGQVTGADVMDESLGTSDIGDGSLGGADIAAGSIDGSDVADGTLTGTDITNDTLDSAQVQGLLGSDLLPNTITGVQIDESSLGQVPRAAVAGIGRAGSRQGPACDPESLNWVDCGFVRLTIPTYARVLIVAGILGAPESDANSGAGFCRLASSVVAYTQSEVIVLVDHWERQPLTWITNTMQPGTYDFGIECNQNPNVGAIEYHYAQVSAVAISAD